MNNKYTNDEFRSTNRNTREDASRSEEAVNRSTSDLSREEILRRRRAKARRLKEKQKKQRIALAIISVIGLIVIWLIYMLLAFIWGLFVPSDNQGDSAKETNSGSVTEVNYFDLPYARAEYAERYKAYGEVNSSLSIIDVVTHTNMGIDVEFFTRDAIEVENSEAIDALVNKVFSLSPEYAPDDLMIVESSRSTMLREEAGNAFIDMQAACKEAGFDIVAVSGYRTYAYQEMVYNNKVESEGVEMANKYVSKPGHSEHSTGLAADIGINGTDYNGISKSEFYPTFYEMLPEYGFIVRYPDGKEALTGYAYEAWHIRYLGVDLAKAVMKSGLTYDEYVARQY